MSLLCNIPHYNEVRKITIIGTVVGNHELNDDGTINYSWYRIEDCKYQLVYKRLTELDNIIRLEGKKVKIEGVLLFWSSNTKNEELLVESIVLQE